MLDEHGKEGYTEVITLTWLTMTLCLVQDNIQNSRKYTFELKDTNYVLIPTAEVPLTNYYRDEILDGKTCQSTSLL